MHNLIFHIISRYIIHLLIKYPNRAIGSTDRADLKGPSGLPIIGNLLLIRRSENYLTFLYDLFLKYGNVVTFTLPQFGRVILLNSPSHIEWFLKENFENYVKGEIGLKMMREFFGDGIFGSNGEMWKFHRKITNQLFTTKNFREIFCKVFEQETKTALNILNDAANKDDTIDLQDLFYRFTLNTFGKISFGIDMKCLEQLSKPLHFAIAFDYVQLAMSQRRENPFWTFTEIFSETGRRIRKEIKYLDEFAYNIIKERKSKKANDSASSSNVSGDVLKLFMDARKDNGEMLTDKELRDTKFFPNKYEFFRISFGIDMKCLEQLSKPLHFAIAFDYVQLAMSQRRENPFWTFTEIFSETGRRIRKEIKYLDEFAYNIIKERKSKKANDSASSSNVSGDVLKLFMDARKDNGRDTTANALTWMMYSLMTNPSVEDTLVREVNQLLSSEENQIPTFDSIKNFHYGEATLYETLRLYPAVPKNSKVCVKHDILPDGTHVYPGENVAWSPWCMGRDKSIWGENALQFYPDRFLTSEGVLKPSQFKFPAFHAGPRICLGQQFATVEALTLATSMLKKFRFELIPGQESPPPYISSITLPMKNPLLVK
ncbi:14698_t:CDS:10, partial [Entrophospora sp. SA101]